MTRNSAWGELSVVLTDDAGIRRINRRYLDSSETTDVISFQYAPMPGTETVHSGEIIVNVQQAIREGLARRGVTREFALYLAHGCDHLANETDLTDEGYTRMRRRELRWLRDADKLGLLSGLIPNKKQA